MPLGNKPLHEPVVTQIYIAMSRHWATMNKDPRPLFIELDLKMSLLSTILLYSFVSYGRVWPSHGWQHFVTGQNDIWQGFHSWSLIHGPSTSVLIKWNLISKECFWHITVHSVQRIYWQEGKWYNTSAFSGGLSSISNLGVIAMSSHTRYMIFMIVIKWKYIYTGKMLFGTASCDLALLGWLNWMG